MSENNSIGVRYNRRSKYFSGVISAFVQSADGDERVSNRV